MEDLQDGGRLPPEVEPGVAVQGGEGEIPQLLRVGREPVEHRDQRLHCGQVLRGCLPLEVVDRLGEERHQILHLLGAQILSVTV